MTFDRKTLVIPENTRFEERRIVTKGDVVIGDRCLIRFGVKTDGRIFVGEHVIIDGDLVSTKDIRVDIFSSIGGDVKSEGNAYFGEKVKVKGKLSVKGDIDVKMGHSEEIDRILEEIEDNEGDTIPISEIFLFIPNNSIIGVQKSKVDTNIQIGKKCKIIGNYDVKGNVFVEDTSEIHGTLKSTGNIIIGKKVSIEGNIDSNGDIRIEEDTKVAGNISGNNIFLSKDASLNGKIFAKNGISFMADAKEKTKEKVRRFESNVDIVDEVDEMLE